MSLEGIGEFLATQMAGRTAEDKAKVARSLEELAGYYKGLSENGNSIFLPATEVLSDSQKQEVDSRISNIYRQVTSSNPSIGWEETGEFIKFKKDLGISDAGLYNSVIAEQLQAQVVSMRENLAAEAAKTPAAEGGIVVKHGQIVSGGADVQIGHGVVMPAKEDAATVAATPTSAAPTAATPAAADTAAKLAAIDSFEANFNMIKSASDNGFSLDSITEIQDIAKGMGFADANEQGFKDLIESPDTIADFRSKVEKDTLLASTPTTLDELDTKIAGMFSEEELQADLAAASVPTLPPVAPEAKEITVKQIEELEGYLGNGGAVSLNDGKSANDVAVLKGIASVLADAGVSEEVVQRINDVKDNSYVATWASKELQAKLDGIKADGITQEELNGFAEEVAAKVDAKSQALVDVGKPDSVQAPAPQLAAKSEEAARGAGASG